MSKNFSKKTLSIKGEYDGYSLWKLMKILRPDWTKVFIIKQLRSKEIKVNNKIAAYNYKLKEGDEVMYKEPEIKKNLKTCLRTINIAKLDPLKVIYEDEGIIIVNKEAKVSVQPSKKHVLQNMYNRLLNHVGYTPEQQVWKPSFVHRLDHNTTGILIGAKTIKAHQKLSEDLKNRNIDKFYKALVFGSFPERTIKIKNWIYKQGEKVMISDKEKPKYKEAVSQIKLLKKFKKTSLVEVQIFTGRKHQVRIHLANMGFPVCGDKRYGKNSDLNDLYPYTALCAYKVIFNSSHPELDKVKQQNIEIQDVWFEDKKYCI